MLAADKISLEACSFGVAACGVACSKRSEPETLQMSAIPLDTLHVILGMIFTAR